MTDRITYPDTWTNTDREALDAMFAEAKRTRLWFYHSGIAGEFWFSAKELQELQEKGQFLWGSVNWRLRDPLEGVDEYEKRIAALMEERNAFVRRVTKF